MAETTQRSIRVDDETWQRWAAEAEAAGLSIAALIHERMAPNVSIARLRADLAEARDLIAKYEHSVENLSAFRRSRVRR